MVQATNPAATYIDRAGEPPPNLLGTVKMTMGAGEGAKKKGNPKLMKPTDKRTAR